MELAKVAEEIARVRRNLKIEEAQFRYRHGDDYKTKYAVEDAMEENKRIRNLRDKTTELDAMQTMIEAVVQSYEGLRNAASREISRRTGERESRD